MASVAQTPAWVSDLEATAGARIDESQVKMTICVDGAATAAGTGSAEAPFRTIREGMLAALKQLDNGIPTKLSIRAGTYREEIEDIRFSGAALDTLFVIEGAGKGKTIWSGTDVWAPSQWEDIGKGVFAHDWPYDWGNRVPHFGPKKTIGQRSELVFLDGKLLNQVILEDYDFVVKGTLVGGAGGRPTEHIYKGVTSPLDALRPGTYGVCERDDSGAFANRIFVKPKNPATFAKATVEVGVRPSCFVLHDKKNAVIRGITFQRTVGQQAGPRRRSPLHLGGKKYANILVESCEFTQTNGYGLLQLRGEHWTIRDSDFEYNGAAGIQTQNFPFSVIEGCRTNFNNWRGHLGGQTGWYVGGIKLHQVQNVILRNHEAVGNGCHGVWFDIQCENVIVDGLVTALNERHGLFYEISNGPFYTRSVLSALHGESAMQHLIVGPSTFRNCIFYNNSTSKAKGGQKGFKPVFFDHWHIRNSPHAKLKSLVPGLLDIRNCAIAGGRQQGALAMRSIATNVDPERKEKYVYVGRQNLFFYGGRRRRSATNHRIWGAMPRGTSPAGWSPMTRSRACGRIPNSWMRTPWTSESNQAVRSPATRPFLRCG
jgi:hypothetical protein